MGANASSIKQVVSTKIQKIVKTAINTNISNEQSTQVTNMQENNIRFNGDIIVGKNGKVTIAQKMLTKAQIFMTNNTAINNDIQNELTSKINDLLTSKTSQENEGITLGQVNISNTETLSEKDIRSSIETAMTTTLETLTTSNSLNRQKLGLEVGGSLVIGEGGTFENLQESSMDIVSTILSDNIVENIAKNIVNDETTGTIDTTNTQKNVGITMGMLIVIAVIIALCGGLYIMIKKGGPPQIRPRSNAVSGPSMRMSQYQQPPPPPPQYQPNNSFFQRNVDPAQKAYDRRAKEMQREINQLEKKQQKEQQREMAETNMTELAKKLEDLKNPTKSQYMYYGGESSSIIPMVTIAGLLFTIANK